ncbi:sushi, von Willebrand factor type A, EGF and pentraxin domain-containing protein 1, partial [Nephila pilipes]
MSRYIVAQVFSVICRPSDLPNGVIIIGRCSYQNSDVCNAYCVNQGQVVWKENITCLPEGKWSPLPICHTDSSLELIRCNKLTDITQTKLSACVKIKISVRGSTSTPRTICPEILRLFVKFGNCSTKLGTECAVSCHDGSYVLLCATSKRDNCTFPVTALCPELRNVKLINCSRVHGAFCKVRCPNGVIAAEEIICLPTNRWSPLPLCSFRSQCSDQKLPAHVRFINNACKRSTALRCKVGCEIHASSLASNFTIHQLVFVRDIECSPSGMWHNLPDCENAKRMFLYESTEKWQCSKPKQYKNAFAYKVCSLWEGSVCHYKCQRGFISIGSKTIRCFMKQWVGEPKCKSVFCPLLPKSFNFDNTCRRIIGSSCYLQCKSGILVGNSRVTCYLSGKWSTLPICSPFSKNCPRYISPYITFVHKCSFKDEAKCQIRCPQNFALVGWHFIKCENGTWKNIPQCFSQRISPYKLLKIKCNFPPRLYGNVKITGSCNPEGGVTCDIACRDGSARITGPNATTCLPPGLWSKIKPCSGGKSYCSLPMFHKHLEVADDCSGKEVGSTCNVRCKYRPKISSFIICTNKLKWSSLPKCSCPLPILRKDIGFRENCADKHPGQKCSLRCKKRYSMVKRSYIMCTNKLEWSSQPTCIRPRCLKPKLTKTLSFKEDCTSKLSGDHCKLECKEGGKLLKHSTIQCIKATHWTKQPKCTCPLPFLTKGVKMNNDCREILPGQKCFLSCKSNSFKISRNYITCEISTRWSDTPECNKKFCPKPILTNALIFEEDCTSKAFSDHCHVSCKELGKPFKLNYIVCLNNMRWTTLPLCTCPMPSLPDFIETKNDCKSKFPGQHCLLICKNGMQIEGSTTITCQNSSKWSKVPKCKRNYCIKRKLPETLLYSQDCTAVSPRKRCLLECKEGGKFFGPNFIVCIHRFLWTPMPTCSCPIPNLSDDIIVIEICDKKRIGQKCHLKCKEHMSLIGKNFIICQNNTRWSHLPKCKRITCLRLKLPLHLSLKEDCSSKYPGESCRLKCTAGGEIIGNHTVTCIEGKKWTILPKCTCPSVKQSDQLILIENCSKKFIGQRCRLKCKFNPSEVKYVICKGNGQWSSLPKCSKFYCIPPKLPKTLAYAENCSSLLPGKSCSVKCKAGGKVIGSSKIMCINVTKWSVFPRCTCHFPLLTEELSTAQKCNHKTVGEKCYVTCKKPLTIIGKDYILCQKDGHWSPLPQCKKLFCPKPKQNNVLKFRENCSTKAVAKHCQLQCREGGSFIGPNYVTCKINATNLYWT